jgi:zinc protease
MKTPNLPGPHNIIVARLANGLQLWVYENHSSPTIVLDAYLHGGAACELPTQAGLAHLCATMLRRGSRRRSFDQINEQLEAVGAMMAFGSGRHVFSFDCKCLSADFDLALALLAESLSEPAFDAGQLEQMRAQFLTGIRERQQNTRTAASLGFRELLFPGHPYGRALSGYEDTITRLSRDDLLGFYEQWLRPAGGVVVVVGDILAEEAVARLEQTLGQWQPSPGPAIPPTPPLPVLQQTAARQTTLPGKSQSDIVLGWRGLSSYHPEFETARVGNSILGQFGMGGRLGANVRQRQGMAYYTSSHLETYLAGGSWYAIAGVHPRNIDRTVHTILGEVERLVHELVAEEELAEVQSRFVGSLPLRLETNAGIAGQLLEMAWFDEGLDHLLTYADRIHSIGRADILRLAQTYLDPACYALSIAGPAI